LSALAWLGCRLRTFACLGACTTIDWFSDWPAEALASLAARFLLDVELDSAEVRAWRGRRLAVGLGWRTPAPDGAAGSWPARWPCNLHYLELIKTYKQLLASKRQQVGLRSQAA
jgi:dynein heavy chain